MALPALDPTESVGRFRAPSNAAERSRGRTVEGTGVRRDDSVPIYTIGHSTRTIDQFVEMLRAAQVTELVDVRSIPRSRTNPQFNPDVLPTTLDEYQINHNYIAELGGRRPRQRPIDRTSTRPNSKYLIRNPNAVL